MAARMSWLWKRKCIRTWTDEIFHYPAKDQSLESTWIPTRKSFYFLNWMYFHFWSGSKSPSRASRLIRNALFLLLYAIIEAWIEHDNTRNVYYESKWCSFRFHVDFRALSWFCETKTLAKSVSESKRRAFFVLDSWKGWGDWPFSRGRQGSPFPRGLPTRYPTAMWAAPEMNPTGRASSVKEEEQQHCKPIVLQHHSQIISKTRPQSQRPEIHIQSACTLNARQGETKHRSVWQDGNRWRRRLRLTCKFSWCLKSCAHCAIFWHVSLLLSEPVEH